MLYSLGGVRLGAWREVTAESKLFSEDSRVDSHLRMSTVGLGGFKSVMVPTSQRVSTWWSASAAVWETGAFSKQNLLRVLATPLHRA